MSISQFNVMEYFHQVFERRNRDGTTFGAINKDDLHSLKLAHPPNELVKSFEKIITPNDVMIFSNH
jgi:type I restriction enzyme S subunit